MGVKHKDYLTVLLLVTCLFAGSEAAAESVNFGEIYTLTEKDYKLGSQIIEELNFHVNRRQSLRSGSHMQYLLEGSDGNLYFFKIYFNQGEGDTANSIFASKFSRMCGLSAPGYYDIWLPVNGKLVYGLIRESKEDWVPFGCEEIPFDKRWLTCFLFRWFIGNEDIDWLISSEGELINYDMDTLADKTVLDFKTYEKANFSRLVRLSLRQGSFDLAYREALGFVNYVEALPDDIIARLCVPYGYEERVKMLILRKKKLRSEFENYCRRIAVEEGKVITVSGPVQDASSYARDVLAGLKESISAKELILKKLPDKQMPRSVSIVASKRKNDFSGDYLMHLPIRESASLVRERIAELKVLRDNSEDFYETLVFSLYINQYEQFIPFYPCGLLPLEEVRFIIPPETMDPKIIEANLCLGYSRNLEAAPARELERFQEYSIDEVGDFIEELASREANAGWNYLMSGNCRADDLLGDDRYLARQAYQKVLTLKQADKEAVYLAHMFLGYLHELNDQGLRFGSGCDLYEAQEQFKLALGVNPRSVPAHLNLLAICLLQDDFRGAKLQVEQLAELDSSWESKAGEVNRLTTEDTQDLAILVLDAEANYVMSLVYLIKGDYDLTEQHLNRAAYLGYEEDLLGDIEDRMLRPRK